MSKKVGVIGSGIVGQVLSDGLIKHGYQVMRGSRDPAKLKDWLAGAGDRASAGTFDQAASYGEIVVLAVKGLAAEEALELCGADNLGGKTVVDATNPIADQAPKDGVVRFFTGPNESLMSRLQGRFPRANFVKAFSSVGNARMVNPDFGGVTPTMFICGNSDRAKAEVAAILTQFGWEAEDMGSVEAAQAIEPLCMLWCIRGFRNNEWMHAFKLLK